MDKIKNDVKQIKLDLDMEVCCDLVGFILISNEKAQDITNICIQKNELVSQDLSSLSFENVIFDHCTFSEVLMESCSFTNVLFNSCAFPNCNFSYSWFNQCKFLNSQFKGSNFSNSRIVNLSIQSSNLRYSNFTSSQFDKCEIIKSDMTDVFFGECTLKKVRVDDAKFIRTEFFHTPLRDIDFTTSTLEGICISDEGKELKGAVVNLYQAAEISKLLGIIIKEE